MDIYRVVIEGKEILVPAQKIKGQLWFHWRGQTRVVESERAGRRSSARSGHVQPGHLLAPMPGKITRIRGAIGDRVEAGEVLIVMEAMKMEYSLKADIKGRITKMSVQVGDQVKVGQALAEIGQE